MSLHIFWKSRVRTVSFGGPRNNGTITFTFGLFRIIHYWTRLAHTRPEFIRRAHWSFFTFFFFFSSVLAYLYIRFTQKKNHSLGVWPRRWQIPAVGLVGWTAEIELSSPILQKDPQNFHEIKPTVHPSLRKFCEESPQIFLKPTRSPPPPGQQHFQKTPCIFLKSTRRPFSLSGTFFEWPSNFTQIM